MQATSPSSIKLHSGLQQGETVAGASMCSWAWCWSRPAPSSWFFVGKGINFHTDSKPCFWLSRVQCWLHGNIPTFPLWWHRRLQEIFSMCPKHLISCTSPFKIRAKLFEGHHSRLITSWQRTRWKEWCNQQPCERWGYNFSLTDDDFNMHLNNYFSSVSWTGNICCCYASVPLVVYKCPQ